MMSLFRIFFAFACTTTPLYCMIRNDSADFATKQLFTCARHGNEANLIDICIEHGGDIFATNNQGKTPLEVALRYQNFWQNKKSDETVHRTEIQKHIRKYETTVRKLRAEELIARRTKPCERLLCIPTKLHILCTCADVVQKQTINTSCIVSHQKHLAHRVEKNTTTFSAQQDSYAKHETPRQLIAKTVQKAPSSEGSPHSSLENKRKIFLSVNIPPKEQLPINILTQHE